MSKRKTFEELEADAVRELDRQYKIDRLDAPVSRRELLAALETIRLHAGCAGTANGELIEDTFRKLIAELE